MGKKEDGNQIEKEDHKNIKEWKNKKMKGKRSLG